MAQNILHSGTIGEINAEQKRLSSPVSDVEANVGVPDVSYFTRGAELYMLDMVIRAPEEAGRSVQILFSPDWPLDDPAWAAVAGHHLYPKLYLPAILEGAQRSHVRNAWQG